VTASLNDLPDGLHAGVAASIYHQRTEGWASASVLRLFTQPPAVYKESYLAGLDQPDEPEEAFKLGTAFHLAELEPAKFADTYITTPEFGHTRKHAGSGTTTEQGKANKEKRDAWVAANQAPGKVLLSPEDWRFLTGAHASIRKHKIAMALLANGVYESTIIWTDPDTKLRCKARPDCYQPQRGLVTDLKSARDVSPDGFAKACFNLCYDQSAAFYLRGLKALGLPAKDWAFVATCKKPPYLTATYVLSQSDMDRAADRVEGLMQKMAKAVEQGVYEGYPESLVELVLPTWRR
jgi:hypothetical protein